MNNTPKHARAAARRQARKAPRRPTPAGGASRIFLLSPADVAGVRARQVLSERARFDLAVRLRTQGAPLGEVFSFISGLYFRGKLAYARRFADPGPGVPGSLIITTCTGLVTPDAPTSISALLKMAAVDLDPTDPRYRRPLARDAQVLRNAMGPTAEVVLLGSVATGKYLEPLLEIFGDNLYFPADFVGRGDLSRGGLMLRCARAGTQLTYVPVARALRHGPRPPRLPRIGADEG